MKTKPCLTLEDCRRITAAAEAEAKKNSWNVTICILDDGGHVLLLTRMDGASPVTAEIATQKGRSAAIARRSTKIGEERIAAGRVALLKMPGLPVQGECVGGIGVSGVQSHEDEQVCSAGLAALK
ncbi:MAG TPA: heme-binding protein [Burkholderiales bacterium]|nr:heme-binding protein [Burkholderiales bacterium]